MKTLLFFATVLLAATAGYGWFDGFETLSDWSISDTSVYISNGNLIIGSDGGVDDFAEKVLTLDLLAEQPIIIEQRLKLESCGNNYLLPWERIFFEDATKIVVSYLSGGNYGWIFWNATAGTGAEETWTASGNLACAPSSENVWATTKVIITSTGGELFVAYDDGTFHSVASQQWSHSQITKIQFSQPWDSINYVDYVYVSVVPEPASLVLTSLGIVALRNKYK